ncbi:MAG: NAD-dependent epimerase/dehydratase family protein [Phycisphaerales bacterium]|nr:MAG: NAD-dependent epimerase/dehydratase family protein [Phycisphaerales bacterium]
MRSLPAFGGVRTLLADMHDEPHNPAALNDRTVCVTGATGFVGGHTVRALLAAGWRVRALVRSPEKGAALRDDRVETVRGDVFDAGAMRDLAAGAAAMVHLIGIRMERKGGVTFQRMHVEATRAALAAAEAGGVRRYVQMSALGVRPNGPCAYYQTKHEAETLVRRSGLDWTILRPSLIHGPDGEFMQMIKGWATAKAPPFLFLPYFERLRFDPNPLMPPKGEVPLAQPVAVQDVAGAVCAALEREDAVGEIFPLGGPDVIAWPDLLETVRDALPGAKRWMAAMSIPGVVAQGVAIGAAAVGLDGLLPFGPSEAVMGTEDNVCSNEKARLQLGFDPQPFAPLVRAYAAQI